VDLRRWGQEFEKQFIELTDEEIGKVAENYHNWQQADYKKTYKNVPEYCYSASFEEIQANDFSLCQANTLSLLTVTAK
jgi:type I restriction enzyme M protein